MLHQKREELKVEPKVDRRANKGEPHPTFYAEMSVKTIETIVITFFSLIENSSFFKKQSKFDSALL